MAFEDTPEGRQELLNEIIKLFICGYKAIKYQLKADTDYSNKKHPKPKPDEERVIQSYKRAAELYHHIKGEKEKGGEYVGDPILPRLRALQDDGADLDKIKKSFGDYINELIDKYGDCISLFPIIESMANFIGNNSLDYDLDEDDTLLSEIKSSYIKKKNRQFAKDEKKVVGERDAIKKRFDQIMPSLKNYNDTESETSSINAIYSEVALSDDSDAQFAPESDEEKRLRDIRLQQFNIQQPFSGEAESPATVNRRKVAPDLVLSPSASRKGNGRKDDDLHFKPVCIDAKKLQATTSNIKSQLHAAELSKKLEELQPQVANWFRCVAVVLERDVEFYQEYFKQNGQEVDSSRKLDLRRTWVRNLSKYLMRIAREIQSATYVAMSGFYADIFDRLRVTEMVLKAHYGCNLNAEKADARLYDMLFILISALLKDFYQESLKDIADEALQKSVALFENLPVKKIREGDCKYYCQLVSYICGDAGGNVESFLSDIEPTYKSDGGLTWSGFSGIAKKDFIFYRKVLSFVNGSNLEKDYTLSGYDLCEMLRNGISYRCSYMGEVLESFKKANRFMGYGGHKNDKKNRISSMVSLLNDRAGEIYDLGSVSLVNLYEKIIDFLDSSEFKHAWWGGDAFDRQTSSVILHDAIVLFFKLYLHEFYDKYIRFNLNVDGKANESISAKLMLIPALQHSGEAVEVFVTAADCARKQADAGKKYNEKQMEQELDAEFTECYGQKFYRAAGDKLTLYNNTRIAAVLYYGAFYFSLNRKIDAANGNLEDFHEADALNTSINAAAADDLDFTSGQVPPEPGGDLETVPLSGNPNNFFYRISHILNMATCGCFPDYSQRSEYMEIP